jgi:hypothetical protein
VSFYLAGCFWLAVALLLGIADLLWRSRRVVRRDVPAAVSSQEGEGGSSEPRELRMGGPGVGSGFRARPVSEEPWR